MKSGFVGQGWRFPVKVNAKGGLSWSSGSERLRDSVWIVVATGRGERVMRPLFGAGVQDFVFQTNTPATRTALADAVKEALVRWEPRIDVLTVRVDEVAGEPSRVLAFVDYRVRATNELFNVVYPLYLEEGVR